MLTWRELPRLHQLASMLPGYSSSSFWKTFKLIGEYYRFLQNLHVARLPHIFASSFQWLKSCRLLAEVSWCIALVPKSRDFRAGAARVHFARCCVYCCAVKLQVPNWSCPCVLSVFGCACAQSLKLRFCSWSMLELPKHTSYTVFLVNVWGLQELSNSFLDKQTEHKALGI